MTFSGKLKAIYIPILWFIFVTHWASCALINTPFLLVLSSR
ncbi:hypothetical protein BN137_3349 [Cronobacter condimenti 1330]|uniref:Uncharacterized protein n=1 Tax=Cronobacter condimenti 1330 TaxID=1073999 RepID=K8A2H8_9ENTR|nr:hypothetical protein BN137_3349 [Cronobacter condimenti 1330]